MSAGNGGGSTRGLTNRASAAGARSAGAPCARSFYGTRQAHKRNSSLLGRARQLQALVRPRGVPPGRSVAPAHSRKPAPLGRRWCAAHHIEATGGDGDPRTAARPAHVVDHDFAVEAHNEVKSDGDGGGPPAA